MRIFDYVYTSVASPHLYCFKIQLTNFALQKSFVFQKLLKYDRTVFVRYVFQQTLGIANRSLFSRILNLDMFFYHNI